MPLADFKALVREQFYHAADRSRSRARRHSVDASARRGYARARHSTSIKQVLSATRRILRRSDKQRHGAKSPSCSGSIRVGAPEGCTVVRFLDRHRKSTGSLTGVLAGKNSRTSRFHEDDGRHRAIAAIGPAAHPPHAKYERLIARAKQVPAAIDRRRSSLRRDIAARAGRSGGSRHHHADPRRTGGKDHCGRARAQDWTSAASRSSMCRTATRQRPRRFELIHEGQRRAADEGQPAHRRAHARGDLRARPACGRRGGSATSSSWTFRPMPRPCSSPMPPSTSFPISMPSATSSRTRSISSLQVGLGTPRVAILSAVETVTSKIPSTIDAAALCKMADRGQITGGLLDGPLAFDNAIDPEAARIKGIRSEVAGRAQILVVPDLEAGNMLAKNLIISCQGGCGRDRPRRARSDHSDVARGFGARAHGLLRGRRALRRCSPRARRRLPAA